MLDKLKLNNLVITNKKLILKARVQTISKLVQKLRKTKTKSDSPKDKDRTRKYMECITELKTQKPVELMRQVLAVSGGNTKSVLTNGRSTPKELAMAMLEENKIMSQLLDSFRQELKLDHDKGKAEWREQILETSKRQAKFQRTEEKKRKRKELKEIKANDKKREEWLRENQQDNSGQNVPEKVEQEQLDNKEENQPTEMSKPPSTQSMAPIKEKTTKLKEKSKPKTNQSNVPIKPKPIKPEENVKPDTQSEASMRHKSTKPKPEMISDESTKQKPTKLKEKPIKKPAKDRPTHVIDPFFITESGQPYLSTAIDNSDDEDEKSPGQAAPSPPANNWRKQKYENTYERPAPTQGQSKKIKFNINGDATISTASPTPVSTEGKHPSWIAKQKWKPRITEFQGSKIKFDDNSIETHVSTPTAPADVTPISTEDKHPSWIAKQKWKPRIAEFQGSKIKFDD